MTRAEHKLLFPTLTPIPLSYQSYIFEKNFYLFSPPPVTCGVSPFATTKKALGFPFYSNTDSGDYRVPGVALNSCVQQLFSAMAESIFVLFFLMKYRIKNNKRILLQLLLGEAKLPGSGGC